MSVDIIMGAVSKYVMTHLQVTFAHVVMDTRLAQIGNLVMVSIILFAAHVILLILSIDIDECSYMTPCSHQCHNTNGSYYCSCIDGFVANGPYCVNSSGNHTIHVIVTLLCMSLLPCVYIIVTLLCMSLLLCVYVIVTLPCISLLSCVYVIVTLPCISLLSCVYVIVTLPCVSLLPYYVCHCYPIMYVSVTLSCMSLYLLLDGDAWLLYSDRFTLRRISTDDNHTNKVLIEMLNYPLSMDYHYRCVFVCLFVCIMSVCVCCNYRIYYNVVTLLPSCHHQQVGLHILDGLWYEENRAWLPQWYWSNNYYNRSWTGATYW